MGLFRRKDDDVRKDGDVPATPAYVATMISARFDTTLLEKDLPDGATTRITVLTNETGAHFVAMDRNRIEQALAARAEGLRNTGDDSPTNQELVQIGRETYADHRQWLDVDEWARDPDSDPAALTFYEVDDRMGLRMLDEMSAAFAAAFERLEGEVSDLEDQLASAEGERDEVREQVGALEEQVNTTQSRLDRQKEKQQAQPEPAATDGDSGGGDGTTVGEFTFSDVQISEDSLGEFDVRARVTNNGGPDEFVDILATIFNEGSVLATAESIEDFDAGQTRTVEFISRDEFVPWDDVEFTVDTL